MTKTDYNGTNIRFITVGCITVWGKYHICGDKLLITSMNGVPNKQYTGCDSENYIWIQKKRDGFENIENFRKGIEFIDKYATPTVRQKCFDELMKLDCQCKELDSIRRAKYIAFFCIVGEWTGGEDFEKYLSNCRRFYEITE